jgi:hypothetical protein
MNPNIALMNTQGTPVMTPYELINGMESIRNNRLTNALNMRKLEQQQKLEPLAEQKAQIETETAKLEYAINKGAHIAQSVQGFLNQPVTPQTQELWQQTRAQIINDVGRDIPNLPQQFDPATLRSVYSQGMAKIKDLADRYKLISTTTGFKRVDMLNNQAEDIGGQQLMAPNADPYLAGQMQQQKELYKGVDVTGGEGEQYRAPQWQANQNFGDPVANVIHNGIASVESGGQQNPARATNPYSSAYGATQVTDATQQDSGFPMPPFPKNGTSEEQKAWSATLYNHYLRTFGGDHNKAIQAWHDGVGAVKEGRPDTTGYVNNVLGRIQSPTIAQKKQMELGAETEAKLTQKKNELQITAQQDLPKVIETTNYTIDLLDKLKNHPGLSIAVGKSSIVPVSSVPGTDAADFKSRLDQLQGQQFLNAYNTLKGGGQITEVEGKKATDAMARLQTSQTEAEFKQSIDELKGVLERARNIASKKAGGNVSNESRPSTGIKFLGFE